MNSPYNLTQLVRDPNNWARTWDSANLMITWNGNGYANDSANSGVYNATYSFTHDPVGGTDPAFSYSSGTGISYQVVSSFNGHSQVLQATDAGSGVTTIILSTALPVVSNISFWWAASSTATAQAGNILVVDSAGTHEVNLGYSETGIGTIDAYYSGSWHAISSFAANTWYYFQIGINTYDDHYIVSINNVVVANYIIFQATGNAPDTLYFCWSNGVGNAETLYLDAIDLSTDPYYYTARASWMLLNCSETFSMTGSYAFRYSVWSSGIEYFPASWLPFSVIDIPTTIPNTAYELDILATEYDLTIPSAMAITYTFHMRLLTTDSYSYRVHFHSLGNYIYEPGDGTTDSYAGEAPNGPHVHDPLLQADDVYITSNVTFSFTLHSEYPIESGTLYWDVYLGMNKTSFSFAWPVYGETPLFIGQGNIRQTREYFFDSSIEDLYYIQTFDGTIPIVFPVPASHVLTFTDIFHLDSYGGSTGFLIKGNTFSDNPAFNDFGPYFDIENYNGLYWDSITPTITNRAFNVQLKASNIYIAAEQQGMKIGVCLWSSGQHCYLNFTTNTFSIPIGSEITSMDYFVWNNTGELITSSTGNSPTQVNTIITLPNSYAYHSIFFSEFSNDGLGVPSDLTRLYVDDNRKTWGPVIVDGNLHNVTVLDYFNTTQYTAILDLSIYSEYNIFINMATLSLYNNQTSGYFTFSIEKNGLLILNQSVAPQNFLLFRFTTGTYNVTAYDTNGTVFESRNITLAANATDLESFGVLTVDFTVVYASQVYQYSLFTNLISWSPDLADDYAMFYPVQVMNYLNYTGTLYFEYLGVITSITVNAQQPYLQPLYVPRNATYKLYTIETGDLTPWTPVSNNVTSGGYVVLNFGSWAAAVYPPNAPPSWLENATPWIIIGIAFVVTIIAFGLVVRDKNRKIQRAKGLSSSDLVHHRGGRTG